MFILKDCLLNGLFISQHFSCKQRLQRGTIHVGHNKRSCNKRDDHVLLQIFKKKMLQIQLKFTLQLKKCDDFKYLHNATLWPVFY